MRSVHVPTTCAGVRPLNALFSRTFVPSVAPALTVELAK